MISFFYRLRNAFSTLSFHFKHWLIIFTNYPEQFPRTRDMSKVDATLWHRDQFYEFLSWGIETGWEPLLDVRGKTMMFDREFHAGFQGFQYSFGIWKVLLFTKESSFTATGETFQCYWEIFFDTLGFL